MLQNIMDFLMEFGVWGLMLHSFADAIIFPIPAFFTQVSLSLIDPSAALWMATAGYIACLLGTPVGYLIGKWFGRSATNKMFKKKWIDSATEMFRKNGDLAILVGSFTPIPFKLFTIMSGVMNFPLWKLLVYAAIGRAVKFYAVGFLFYVYSHAAESMVKDVSLYMGLIAAAILIVVVIVKKRQSALSRNRG